MEKEDIYSSVLESPVSSTVEVARKWQGTEADQHDMLVIGRRQQLRRNYQFITILGFGCCLICTWEINLTTFGIGLLNGGTAGIIYGFITVAVGFTFVYASLAELASMSPTAGGQYHWISEFSPPSCQRYLSYMSGWLCFTGWQASIGSIGFLAGNTIQALIILCHPDTYTPHPWHGTLLVIAIVIGSFVFNSVLSKRLALLEGIVLAVHVASVLAIIIPLWILLPRKSGKEVFTEFNNGGGWSSMGLSFMVGLLPLSGSLAGIDCVVHMGEEVQDASRILPRMLMTSLPLNASLGFLIIITLCFCTVDVEAVMASPVGLAGYPFIQIFYDATGSLAATTVLTILPLIALVGSVIAEIATASRQLWSFARDGGVPFASVMAKVHPRHAIPLNAITTTLLLNLLLPLINIGSTAALNAIFSLAGVSILSSYVLCIGSLIHRRLSGPPLPQRRWTLGRYGLLVNAVAMVFLFPLAVFQFFPPFVPVTPQNMNYGSLMYGAVIVFSTAYYAVWGRKTYSPPVLRVRRDA